jgi:signal transduction histidine kinase
LLRLRDVENFRNVRIETEILKSDLNCDQEVICDILYHVAHNSIQYYDRTKSDPFVKIVIHGTTDQTVFEVIDNGIGINSDVVPNIFDLFYRGTDTSKGSGLGLYLAKNAVDRLGGTIDVKSTKRRGTSVKVILGAKP